EFQISHDATVKKIQKTHDTSIKELIESIKRETQSMKGPMNQITSIDASVKKIQETMGRCPEGERSFTSPGSFQCFRIFLDRPRTWEEANLKCKAEGMVLPKPFNAVVLRKYLMERF
ncbi:unnamed protein product, partial [Meganyctiphanes norvegica]